MTRFLYKKEGNAVWISHLDMMRMFQRAFRRAGIEISLTGGYNPHAWVSIAMPLPVGMESECEILDCRLADETIDPCAAAGRLNRAGFPEGITVLNGYSSERKIHDLKTLRSRIELIYDDGIPAGTEEAITSLLLGDTLVVEKRVKKQPKDVDVRSLLFELDTPERLSETRLRFEVMTAAGDTSLNPELLVQAIGRYLPEYRPSFSKTRRIEVYDAEGRVFR